MKKTQNILPYSSCEITAAQFAAQFSHDAIKDFEKVLKALSSLELHAHTFAIAEASFLMPAIPWRLVYLREVSDNPDLIKPLLGSEKDFNFVPEFGIRVVQQISDEEKSELVAYNALALLRKCDYGVSLRDAVRELRVNEWNGLVITPKEVLSLAFSTCIDSFYRFRPSKVDAFRDNVVSTMMCVNVRPRFGLPELPVEIVEEILKCLVTPAEWRMVRYHDSRPQPWANSSIPVAAKALLDANKEAADAHTHSPERLADFLADIAVKTL
jgi:hypothetical protein